ncbi:hypothetical protein MO973_19895 [Paenibacillus sp. TRM 82003]|nr:hypothetical protein [Paenibacillus sp. TRM 82003]
MSEVSFTSKYDKKLKERLIKKEIKELTELFTNIDNDQRNYINRLINQVAFMSVTLQELQEILNNDGSVELFVNGAQKMLREHPAAKLYNTTIKNYSALIKQLSDLTPTSDEDDPLSDYLKRKAENV